jgi:ABC-type multidrug transport system ATPase subunit
VAFGGFLGETRVISGPADSVEGLAIILFLVVLQAPLAAAVFRAAAEREAGLHALLARLGVQLNERQWADAFVDAVAGTAAAAAFSVGGLILRLRTLSQTSFLLIIEILVAHIVAQIGVGMVLKEMTRGRDMAAFVGVAFGVVTPLAAAAVASTVYGRSASWSLNTPLPLFPFYVLPILGPQFALARALYLCVWAAVAQREPLKFADAEVASAIWAMLCTGAVHALFALVFMDKCISMASMIRRLAVANRLVIARCLRRGVSAPGGMHYQPVDLLRARGDAEILGEAEESIDCSIPCAAEAALPPPVALYNVSVDFPGCAHPALDNVSLSFQKGSCHALVGGNGAGKSTLLRLLSQTLEPTRGSVLVRGRVALCPQADELWPHLTAQEHVHFAGQCRGFALEKCEELLKSLGFSASEANTRAEALSGGWRRRLCVALALVGSPAIILLDEPSASLDAASRHALWRALTTARASLQDTIWVIVTHDLREARCLAGTLPYDGIVLMKKGRVAAVGPAAAVAAKLNRGVRLRVSFDGGRQSSSSDVDAVTALFEGLGTGATQIGNTVETRSKRWALFVLDISISLSVAAQQMLSGIESQISWELDSRTLEGAFGTQEL